MNISLKCPECKRILSLPLSAAGKSVCCPMCTAVFNADVDPDGNAPVPSTPSARGLEPDAADTGIPAANWPAANTADTASPVPPKTLPDSGPPRVMKPGTATSRHLPKGWAGGYTVVIGIFLLFCFVRAFFDSPTPIYKLPPQFPAELFLSSPRGHPLQATGEWRVFTDDAVRLVENRRDPPDARVIHLPQGHVTSLVFMRDADLIVGSDNGQIYKIDANTGFIKSTFNRIFECPILAASTDRSYVAIASSSEPELVVDVELPGLSRSVQVPAVPDVSSGAGSLAFAPDCHTLAYVEAGQLCCFGNADWEHEIGKAFSAHVKSFAFAPTGSTIAVALDDGTLNVWSLLTTRSTHAFHVELVSAPCYSPDGRLVAGCTAEAELFVWDLTRGILSKKWRDPKNPQAFRTGVFAPDGKRFAVWQNDGVIRVWDVQSGKVLTDLPAERCDPERPPPVLIFQKDGNTLVAGGGQTVTFWDVSDTKKP